MTITQNGNSFTWTGTVTVTNATNLTTGVATLVLTPAGGVGQLPFMAQGNPGLPPALTLGAVTTLTVGSSATATLSQTSAGGPGVASAYSLALGIPVGATGTSGTFEMADATDLESTFGSGQDQFIIKWQNADSAFKAAAQAVGDTYQATSFTAASGNSSFYTLATVTVAAQPFNWRPCVRGQAIPSGTANTHVDLRCLMNNATSGDQVGWGQGLTGAGTTWPALPLTLGQAFGGAISGGYGVVSAGSAATFYFQAAQSASTTDAYAVPTSGCYFTVKVDPIPGTN